MKGGTKQATRGHVKRDCAKSETDNNATNKTKRCTMMDGRMYVRETCFFFLFPLCVSLSPSAVSSAYLNHKAMRVHAPGFAFGDSAAVAAVALLSCLSSFASCCRSQTPQTPHLLLSLLGHTQLPYASFLSRPSSSMAHSHIAPLLHHLCSSIFVRPYIAIWSSPFLPSHRAVPSLPPWFPSSPAVP